MVLLSQGYEALTLQNIAKIGQLSPAALSKRFGSKKGMLLAYYEHLIEVTRHSFAELAKRPLPLLDALIEIFTQWHEYIKTPQQLANLMVLYLNFDIDPELIAKSRERMKMVDAEVQRILADAVTRGELICEDIPKLSHALQAAATGAALLWCKEKPGTNPKKRIADSLSLILLDRKVA